MKKRILPAVLSALLLTQTVSAYDFPEPDWGAVLKERTQMVTETQFDLYVEGDPSLAPYYGAKLEPKAGTYIGMVADQAESYLPLGSYLTYVETPDQEDLYYPSNSMIKRDDVVTMVGWNFQSLDDVDYGKMRQTLDMLNGYNKPMMIRFANEMNVSSLGDDPDRYVEAFRNVANMIHEYPNFAVVWSPNDMGALDRPFEYYYPGDEYVDWVGISCYMIRYFGFDKNAQARDHIFFMTDEYAWATNKVQLILKFMEEKGIQKPVMLSEGGVACYNSNGDDYSGWSEPRMRNMYWYLIMKYPQIKMINYFNVPFDNYGEHYYFSDKSGMDYIFREAAANGAYLRSADDTPKFVFKQAYDGGTIHAENGKIKLYTYAYFANQPNLTVNYRIDDTWYSSSDAIPYSSELELSGLSDGEHKLTISALGESKDYYFHKKGNFVKFGGEPNTWEEDIRVIVNGDEVAFPDQKPAIVNDRTLVPLRAIFEALKAEVAWDDETKTVTSKKGDISISLAINSDRLYQNGQEKILDVPAQIMNGRTMVPVRAISEAFQCQVGWDQNTRTVTVEE
mgnify:FL=1